MGRHLNRSILYSLTLLFSLTILSPEAPAQATQVDGTVVGIGGRLSGTTRPFRLIVNRLTPPAAVSELNQAIGSGGQDNLLRALSRLNAGRISIGNGVGVRANAIIADRWGNGGTKLTVFYERNINFYELRYGTRSEDYKVGYAEIYLDNR